MRRVGGFTLIEMLVVVAIIMVLAAIIYPVYEIANKRADTIHCVNNMKHVATAALLYAGDYDDFLVPARVSSGPPGTLGTGWDVLLLPYHNVQELYLCLSDQTPDWAAGTVCYKHSYGINYEVAMIGGYNNAALPLERIQSPTQTILFFEIKGNARALGTSVPAEGFAKVETRHNDGANFAFVDGHVKWYHPRTTYLDATDNMWVP